MSVWKTLNLYPDDRAAVGVQTHHPFLFVDSLSALLIK